MIHYIISTYDQNVTGALLSKARKQIEILVVVMQIQGHAKAHDDLYKSIQARVIGN